MKKKLVKKIDNYTLIWVWSEDRLCVDVDVHRKGNKFILKWSYGKAPGHSSLAANALFWGRQAMNQYESEAR